MTSKDRDEYRIVENTILHGSYKVKNLIGEGSFGKVIRCIKIFTGENVAVKVVKKNLKPSAEKEVDVFKKLSILDLDKCNLVKFYESFMHDGHLCLVMEMLDKSLHHFIFQGEGQLMCLSAIRVITQQMLVALNALKSIGLLHGDIKPDNVMLVDQCRQPFRIKLIDFGLAIPAAKVKCGTIVQALGYRAPEVILGVPLNEAADMWSLGCILAFLYVSQHLYPLKCEYEVIRVIMKMHGGIDDHLLDAGMYTKKFFHKDADSEQQTWKLNTRTQYKLLTGKESKASTKLSKRYACLEDITKDHPLPVTDLEKEDTLRFLSLLKNMLHVDPVRRITPSEGLEHEFITMRHFPDDSVPDPYVILSYGRMNVCLRLESEAEMSNSVTSSEASDDGVHSISSEPRMTTAGSFDENNTGCTDNLLLARQKKNKPAPSAPLPGRPKESKRVRQQKKSTLKKSKGKKKTSKPKLTIKLKEPEEKCKPKESKPMLGGKSKESNTGDKPKQSKPEEKPNKCKPNESKSTFSSKQNESKPGLKPKNSHPGGKPEESKLGGKQNYFRPAEETHASKADGKYRFADTPKESKPEGKPSKCKAKESKFGIRPKESDAGSEPSTSKTGPKL